MTRDRRNPASFRDNRGHIITRGDVLLRQINPAGADAYDALMNSGLYQELVDAGLLISHQEVEPVSNVSHRLIQPEIVPVISYPYEWSFSQLQSAALLTLDLQRRALKRGLVLRDASAYNVQFVEGRPLLIDTLSFGHYAEGEPWQAYRQFCQHFLAPLALMAYRDPSLLQLLRVHLDGIPLPLAAHLLPARAKLRPGLLVHLTMHARLQTSHQSDDKPAARTMNRTALDGLIDNLYRLTTKLQLAKVKTEWADYYDNTNYSDTALREKADLVTQFVKQTKPRQAIDLGGNNGYFGRVVAAAGTEQVVCADIDPLAVEDNYRTVRRAEETTILPLLVDLTNPSPDLGWNNEERSRFSARTKSDLAMALALVHHLAISNNVPLEMIAESLSAYAPWLIIEFIPKQDSQVRRLLATREDIFPDYTREGFEAAFKRHYTIEAAESLKDSSRTLYLMKRLAD